MPNSLELLNKAEATIEWYWQHGAQRNDPRYEVLRGTWLDAAYQCRNRTRGILAAEVVAKPCLALWGPSQTGKSTLMSKYLDDADDDKGDRSALKWSDSEPVRFVVGRDKSAQITVLNPFNFGSDASGCVSRFSMKETVPDPEHPVEVVFASEWQILHALAVGYLSECQPLNSKAGETSWDSDNFTALLAGLKPSGPPQRKAFEFLQQLAETLDLIILSEQSRYPSLKPNWTKSLRPKMLECPGLASSVEQVEAFAFELLWDSWASLTHIYKALASRRRELISLWGTSNVFCSYRVAALLLDIDSYKKCSENIETQKKVDSLSARVTDGTVILDHAGGGTPFARGKDDFGLLQGLVWELHFPLRKEVLSKRSAVLTNFFEQADLMDFPGVANSYGNAERHTDADVAANRLIALTEVLKRGKTASIVVTRARAMDIDGFSLLMRLGKFPAQPKQLVSGISSWLGTYGYPVPPQGKPMPINLVMTFCANLINQVVQSGTRQGLQPCFDQLKSLGWLADPKTVNAIATNYPQFNECIIHGTDAEKQQALDSILGDGAFHERFGDSAESFREMFADGGTDHFFRQLTTQAQQSRRKQILNEQVDVFTIRLVQLIAEHLPGEVAALEERNRLLDDWRDGILVLLQRPPASEHDPDAATKLSCNLRHFLNFDPEEIDDIPANAIRSRLPVRAFIEKQFRSWQTRRASWPELQELGLKDGTHAQRVLSSLIEATDLGAIETFFKENLGYMTSRVDCKQCRRYLATQMNNEILRGPGIAPRHRSIDEVRGSLDTLAAAEDSQEFSPESSPHYISVIAPLLARLESIKKNSNVKGRPAQPGDAELSRIAKLP